MPWFRLVFLCSLTAPSVFCLLDGTCPRKEPPPGVLVVSPGSTLVLGCSGEVEVNGQRVTVKGSELTRTSRAVQTTTDKAPLSAITDGNPKSTSAKTKDNTVFVVSATPVITGKEITGTNLVERPVPRNPPIRRHSTVPGREDQYGNGEAVEKETDEDGEGGGEQNESGPGLHTVNQQKHSDSQSRAPPTGMTLRPTAESGVGGAETEQPSDLSYEDTDSDYEEEGVRGRRARGLRGRSYWRLNGRLLRGGRGGVLGRRGATLTLPSLALSDSGNYSCHHGGQRHFSLRVSVADPPERPTLSCYKKSPSSKIRCDWTASKLVTPVPQCFLLLRKRLYGSISRVNCSYTARLSRCWCALDHNVEENRDPHLAYLCVTNTAGNTTSPPLDFLPLGILKPDPPSSVFVRVVEGEERRLRVSWSFPNSWKDRDMFHQLEYELRYHTMPQGIQMNGSTTARSFTITDAFPGVQYLIQIRAKDDLEGYWSDWSPPVYARTWTASVPTSLSNLTTIMDTEGIESGSGMIEEPHFTESPGGVVKVWPHILWVVGSCVLLSITVLFFYLYRNRKRFMSKLLLLNPVSPPPVGTSHPATAPPLQEEHALLNFALVNFDTSSYTERLPQEEERKDNEEKEGEEEGVVHFNNTSYFLVQSS